AEDGIRDYKVTGVQTCALPICIEVPSGSGAWARPDATKVRQSSTRADHLCDRIPPQNHSLSSSSIHFLCRQTLQRHPLVGFSLRSEERRVGKECRSR